MEALEALVAKDAPTLELQHVWRIRALEDFGYKIDPLCRRYLEDKAGCLRCNPSFHANVQLTNSLDALTSRRRAFSVKEPWTVSEFL